MNVNYEFLRSQVSRTLTPALIMFKAASGKSPSHSLIRDRQARMAFRHGSPLPGIGSSSAFMISRVPSEKRNISSGHP